MTNTKDLGILWGWTLLLPIVVLSYINRRFAVTPVVRPHCPHPRMAATYTPSHIARTNRLDECEKVNRTKEWQFSQARYKVVVLIYAYYTSHLSAEYAATI
jgi:hypothetical protein